MENSKSLKEVGRHLIFLVRESELKYNLYEVPCLFFFSLYFL